MMPLLIPNFEVELIEVATGLHVLASRAENEYCKGVYVRRVGSFNESWT